MPFKAAACTQFPVSWPRATWINPASASIQGVKLGQEKSQQQEKQTSCSGYCPIVKRGTASTSRMVRNDTCDVSTHCCCSTNQKRNQAFVDRVIIKRVESFLASAGLLDLIQQIAFARLILSSVTFRAVHISIFLSLSLK